MCVCFPVICISASTLFHYQIFFGGELSFLMWLSKLIPNSGKINYVTILP